VIKNLQFQTKIQENNGYLKNSAKILQNIPPRPIKYIYIYCKREYMDNIHDSIRHFIKINIRENNKKKKNKYKTRNKNKPIVEYIII
jgi:hypothetical protein